MKSKNGLTEKQKQLIKKITDKTFQLKQVNSPYNLKMK